MFLRATEGEYLPSFFTIKIKLDKTNFNIIELVENSTFIHEYIHFIQDIILPYCIRMNLTYIRCFNDICKYGKKNSKIEIPFKNWSKDTKDLIKQLDYTFGSKKDKKKLDIKSIVSNHYSFNGFDNHTNSNRTLNVYMYTITFINDSKYQLGARDLLEYIAYSIEKKHYKTENSCKEFPYKTVDILFDYYNYSELDDAKRVLIAEYCLHNDNPIRYLIYNVFGNINIMDIITQNSVTDLYNILPNILTVSTDLKSETFYDKEKRRLSEFLNQLQYIYNHSDQLKNWLNSVNAYSKLKFQGTFIFTNLFTMSTNLFKSTFINMIDNLGLPLIVNNKDEIINIKKYSFSNSSNLEYFLMVERFIHFAKNVNSSNKTCPIGDFCKENYGIKCKKMYDLNNNIQGCPYKNFLKTNNIDNVLFQQNK